MEANKEKEEPLCPRLVGGLLHATAVGPRVGLATSWKVGNVLPGNQAAFKICVKKSDFQNLIQKVVLCFQNRIPPKNL